MISSSSVATRMFAALSLVALLALPRAGEASCPTCTDPNECQTAVCNQDTGTCEPINKPEGTPCADTDQDSCTSAGCEAGSCVQSHTINCLAEICRTPEFWGTHAGTERKKSQNITQAIINAAGGCITACGEKITNTSVDSADSALEAMCSGGGTNELARQLAAAALNCLLTNGNADCANASVGPAWAACDAACIAGSNTANVGGNSVNCINAIDCFNNGGDFNGATGFCKLGTCSITGADCNRSCPRAPTGQRQTCTPLPANCHSSSLNPNALGITIDESQAGSSKACNSAKRSTCTLVPTGETACKTGLACSAPETCGQDQC